jgi:hypothetical protein
MKINLYENQEELQKEIRNIVIISMLEIKVLHKMITFLHIFIY